LDSKNKPKIQNQGNSNSSDRFDPSKSFVNHMVNSNSTNSQNKPQVVTKKRKFKVPYKKDEKEIEEQEPEPEAKFETFLKINFHRKKKIAPENAKELSDLFPDG
jgi:hypothetical protein